MSNTVEDFLDVDSAIRGQNYVCLSFISPNDMIEKRTLFYMNAFLRSLLKEKYDMTIENLEDEFESFKIKNDEAIEKDFNEKVNFRTSVRGLKVRGVYDTLREAQVRAEVLRRKDPHFDVFVGQVGYWLPWDPEAKDKAKVENQEYLEKELNTLMKNYKENMNLKDEFWANEKEERKKRAIEEGKSLNSSVEVEHSENQNDAYGIENNVERVKEI